MTCLRCRELDQALQQAEAHQRQAEALASTLRAISQNASQEALRYRREKIELIEALTRISLAGVSSNDSKRDLQEKVRSLRNIAF